MKRILLCALAIPALTLAPVANADNLDVLINPGLGGVAISITSHAAGLQNCNYSAVPRQPSLLPPTSRNFDLGVNGQVLMNIPGMPTGTVWDVSVNCSWKVAPPMPTAGPGAHQIPQPGSFRDTVTY